LSSSSSIQIITTDTMGRIINYKYIDLTNKGLYDDDLDDVLYKVIEKSPDLHNTILVALKLGWNKLTLADGKFARAIAKNTPKKLYLYNNKIGPRGIKQLADALKDSKITMRLKLKISTWMKTISVMKEQDIHC